MFDSQKSIFKEKNPVNEIKLPYNGIKAYDTQTPLKVELFSEKEKATDIDEIAFFILANNKDEFTNVTDYQVNDGEVTFTIPKIKEDKYYPQIMDKTGRVFSSNNLEYIDVVYNQESRTMEVFPIIKKQVVDEVTPHVKQFVMDNVDYFRGHTGDTGIRGEKGEKGDKGDRGFKGNQGVKGDKGDKGDTGEKGEKGDRGFKGNQGEQGIQGEQGEKGDKGDKGDDGNVDFEALTPEQIEMLKGEDGVDGQDGTVDFDTLTPEQLMMLTPEFVLEPNGDLYYKVRER